MFLQKNYLNRSGCFNSNAHTHFGSVSPYLPYLDKLNVEGTILKYKSSFEKKKEEKKEKKGSIIKKISSSTNLSSNNSKDQNSKGPLFLTKFQFELVFLCAEQFKSYFSNMFIDFSSHCVRDKTDKNNIVSIFLPESYLSFVINTRPSNVKDNEVQFFEAFFETQIFIEFSERRRSDDEKKMSGMVQKKEINN